MHKMEKTPPTSRELREFGLITGAVAALLFGLLLPWLGERPWPLWPWTVAACLWVPALVFPSLLAPIRRAWLAVGDVLGWINTRILLGLLFFLAVLPTGLLMRLAGKDPLRRRLDPGAATYRVPSETPPPNHFERPF